MSITRTNDAQFRRGESARDAERARRIASIAIAVAYCSYSLVVSSLIVLYALRSELRTELINLLIENSEYGVVNLGGTDTSLSSAYTDIQLAQTGGNVRAGADYGAAQFQPALRDEYAVGRFGL